MARHRRHGKAEVFISFLTSCPPLEYALIILWMLYMCHPARPQPLVCPHPSMSCQNCLQGSVFPQHPLSLLHTAMDLWWDLCWNTIVLSTPSLLPLSRATWGKLFSPFFRLPDSVQGPAAELFFWVVPHPWGWLLSPGLSSFA